MTRTLRRLTACRPLRVADGLALERALLARAAVDGGTAGVRVWSPIDRALVVPRRLMHAREFADASARLARLGYPVLTRDSGGDVVPEWPGTLNIALAFAAPGSSAPGAGLTIESVYRKLCDRLLHGLGHYGIEASIGAVPGSFCDGRYNVTVAGHKIAGTAQRWRRTTGGRLSVLAHAIVLVDPDLPEMIHAVNAFYAACGSIGRCKVASHTTLFAALAIAKRDHRRRAK